MTVLISSLIGLSVLAQNPTVSVTLRGSQNQQLLVDGRDYTPTSNTVGLSNVTVTITDLQPGQHTIEVIRSDDNDVNTSFTLRANYDKKIIVTAGGGLQQSEMRSRTTMNNKTPMSDAQFQALLQSVQNEWRAVSKRRIIRDAFNNAGNFFTTAQAYQLIQSISGEAHRLELAKASYRSITDPVNFSGIYDLLSSPASRNELLVYVNNYNSSNAAYINRVPMTDADYSTLYQNIQAQYSQSTRLARIADAFTNISNFFTTYQVKQLLLLLSDERNRLESAKLSYRGITDPANFNQVYDVLSSASSRNELAAYVRSYNANKTPMSSTRFNSVYQNIRNQSVSLRPSSVAHVFTDGSNFYTTIQARQLLLLVSSQADRLELAKLSYRGITDPVNFSQLYDVLSSQPSRNELAAYVNSYNGGTPYTSRIAMSEADYNRLYNSVANRFGLGAKMSALTDIFANASYYFTTDQAERLIRLVSSESNRLQLAKSSYSHITDPANFSQLYDVLSTQASRDELDAYVRNSNVNTGYDNGDVYNNPYRIPMGDADYNTLYNRIRNTWGLGAKMSALTDVFANANNFFTVAQAENLIRLVSAESNRLQLAKSSYSHITDPANFSDLYDMFSSQASVDELKAYVSQQ